MREDAAARGRAGRARSTRSGSRAASSAASRPPKLCPIQIAGPSGTVARIASQVGVDVPGRLPRRMAVSEQVERDHVVAVRERLGQAVEPAAVRADAVEADHRRRVRLAPSYAFSVNFPPVRACRSTGTRSRSPRSELDDQRRAERLCRPAPCTEVHGEGTAEDVAPTRARASARRTSCSHGR